MLSRDELSLHFDEIDLFGSISVYFLAYCDLQIRLADRSPTESAKDVLQIALDRFSKL